MIEFITNNLGTIVVGAVVITIVGLIVVRLISNKKKGKTSCGCDCKSCPSHGICHK